MRVLCEAQGQEYIPARCYGVEKPGYQFVRGPQGLGYYKYVTAT